MEEQPTLDPEITKELKRILEKEPRELIQSEIDFLRARRAYVGKNSRAKFADVFNDTPQKPQDSKKKATVAPQNPKQEKKIDINSFPGDTTDDEDEDEDIIDPTTGLPTRDHEDDDEE